VKTVKNTVLGLLALFCMTLSGVAADYTAGLSDAVAAGTNVLGQVNYFVEGGATIKFALLGISMVVALAYWGYKRK